MAFNPIITLLLVCLGVAAAVLVIIFVLVPLLKGVGWMIAGFFKSIGWIVAHLFEFVGGMIGDAVRLVGAILASVVLLPMVPLNVIIGRWSGAGHFANAIKRESAVGAKCVYRMVLRRPLKLFWLHGLLEGVEERVPEAMGATPPADKPSKRTGQFEGYTIVGSLRGGGSGAKLYIAEPDPEFHKKEMPELVVIKSFAISEGSSLPQIVRESRALECAKKIGLVLDHAMDEHRFFYVMAYHAGDHLGIVTRQLHGETDGRGLETKQLREVVRHAGDLLETLGIYHKNGLWHKDVKPENIIVDDGTAHLVDLGLVTPLHSAMTLTTHGTEYFRDPEMVRQALRGVKVHQVDGTKFDVFAAGAVLYFMLENTFPAHGGLSRFSKKSPQALRWIVKRAMADYNQRYKSADAMLADLMVVAAASDPYAVKPAALPSMGGANAAAVDAPEDEVVEPVQVDAPVETEQEVAEVRMAATPAPGSAPGSESSEPYIPPVQVSSGDGGRPKIQVANWWTGEYTVEGDGPGNKARTPSGWESQESSPEVRREFQDLRRKARAEARGDRQAARDQVKTARGRARDIQQRARERARGHRSSGGRRPLTNTERGQAFVFFIVSGLVLAFVVVLGLAMFTATFHRPAVSVTVGPEVLTSAEVWANGAQQGNFFGEEDGLPVLLIEHESVGVTPILEKQVEGIVEQEKDEGYFVVEGNFPWREEFEAAYGEWQIDPTGPADDVIEDLMEEHNLYGILYLHPNGNFLMPGLTSKLVWAERAGAEERRWPSVMASAAWDGAWLLVNDHPTRGDRRVNAEVEQLMYAFQQEGLELIIDDEIEPDILAGLSSNPEESTSPALQRAMRKHHLAGVIRVYAPSGKGEAGERIGLAVYRTQEEGDGLESVFDDSESVVENQ